MGKYNDTFDKLNTQINKIDFQTALDLGLLCCIQDLHYYSDYLKTNQISENIFDVFESSIFNIIKNRWCLVKEEYANALNFCNNFLDSFFEEENELYNECVNLCCEIIHLLEFIASRENKLIFAIIQLWFENQEAFMQKNYSDCDAPIEMLLDKISLTLPIL